MDRMELLKHNIYVPEVWDESIVVYLNLGFKILCRLGYTICLIQLWTEDFVPGHAFNQFYKLRLIQDEDFSYMEMKGNRLFYYLSIFVPILYVPDTSGFIKRINHNMYD